jgi:DNA polymerase (family 10)
MTRRVLSAMDDPHLAILGHPTGRLLLAREAFAIDLDKVLAKAALRGIAVEVNADPHRLDLDWRVVRQARDAGVTISIGADAHSTSGMSNVAVGLGIARKGWVEARDVLNTRDADSFLAFTRQRRAVPA